MNRTLLLILCDFLLLTLLALTDWERAEPAAEAVPPAASLEEGSPGARTAAQDMVEVMKLSLEDEQANREQLANQLGATQEELAERERALAEREANLARVEAERRQLSSSLQSTQESAAELARQIEAAKRDASVSQERMAQLQRDLEAREAEARQRATEVLQLERAQAAARQRIENLNVAVQVAEQEKSLLRQTADAYRDQVAVEREERQRVQATATQLAQGVGELAESSKQITREIRDNRPINANTLFSEYLANRVPAQFQIRRAALLGDLNRDSSPTTVLVSDGVSTYAILHVDDTPFNLREPAADWQRVDVTLTKDGHRSSAPRLDFLAVDPRVVAVPVSAFQVSALGVKVYQLATDPFKFPEAVLISNGGAGYGEVPFKLDPRNPSYVRMDNRLVRRLFGDFSPSRGDLVLSKTGELLGVMVSNDVCALVNTFATVNTLPTGDTSGVKTSTVLSEIAARVSRLPGGR